MEVDGQTLDRDGIKIRIVETGDLVMTRADGSFQFPRLDPGWYTLDFAQSATGATPRRLASVESDESDKSKEHGEREDGKDEEQPKREEDKDAPERERPEDGEHEGERPEKEKGHDCDDDEEQDEDHDGRPRVELDRDGPVSHLRISLDGDRVVSWSKSNKNHRFARSNMETCEGGRPTDVTGQIRVREWFGGERSRLSFKICNLRDGATVGVYMRDPSNDRNEWKLVEDGKGNGACCLNLKIDTKKRDLPFEATNVDDLAGFAVKVETRDGLCLLEGEVPALPDRVEKDGKPEIEEPEFKGPIFGKDRLVAQVDGVFGNVAIGHWGRRDLSRFTMFAGGLRKGATVLFQIRESERDDWQTLATRVAEERDGKEIGYVAKVDTGWYGVLPLHARSVRALIGLGVRVVLAGGEREVVLLTGEVPTLARE